MILKPPSGLMLMEAARMARALGGQLVALDGHAYIQSPGNLLQQQDRRLAQLRQLSESLAWRAIRLVLRANDLRLRLRGRKLRPAQRADLIERMEIRAARLDHYAVLLLDEELPNAELAYREFSEEFLYGL